MGTAVSPGRAEAQYKSGQFGFEAGYLYLNPSSLLNTHNLMLGLRGGYKVSDHWWFTARAQLSFPSEQVPPNSTVVLLHLAPVDARYYFQTDTFRPFLGVTNSFQFFFNQDIGHTVVWGPGACGGMEFRLRRDLYLGVQADVYYMFEFEGTNFPMFTLTSQILFFL